MHASVPTRARRAPERQDAASSDGGHLRGAPQRGHVSPALVCLDFYVLTAGKARCFPGLGGLGTRVAGMRFGTLDGFGEEDPAFGREGWIGDPSPPWSPGTLRPAVFAALWIL